MPEFAFSFAKEVAGSFWLRVRYTFPGRYRASMERVRSFRRVDLLPAIGLVAMVFQLVGTRSSRNPFIRMIGTSSCTAEPFVRNLEQRGTFNIVVGVICAAREFQTASRETESITVSRQVDSIQFGTEAICGHASSNGSEAQPSRAQTSFVSIFHQK